MIGSTRRLKLPPITVMMKKYSPRDAVRILFGARSTIMADVTPIHISPMILEGMRVRKHHGYGKKSAPAAKGAAAT